MIDTDMLTGQSTAHLASFGQHRLHPQALSAFQSMQQQAALAGFNLQPASTFRDFHRQQIIWNDKFNGKRPVLDANSQPIDISPLTPQQRCLAILRWSALPGASRHHWGSDLDIYDPDLLPMNQKLRLEPEEYENGGYFSALTLWLTENMAKYGFYRPFQQDCGGVATEPWHLSYRPLAEQYEQLLTPDVLLNAWQGKDIAGYEWLKDHLSLIFAEFINPHRTGVQSGLATRYD